MTRTISSRTSLDQLKKDAKRWFKALDDGDIAARERFARAWPDGPNSPTLRDVQHALAREYGYEGWVALAGDVAALAAAPSWERMSTADLERLAADFVSAFDRKDDAALQRVNTRYARAFSHEDLADQIWRRVYAFRRRSSREDARYLELDEARTLIAQDAGFPSWNALTAAPAARRRRVPPYTIDSATGSIAPARHLADREWDELVDVMRTHHVTRLAANGMMSDATLARVAALGHVVGLDLGGSRQVTDDGLRHLRRMPQLQRLELSGCGVTDRGLEVLRDLPHLRRFDLNWQRGVSDAGIAHLQCCDELEHVSLMGTAAGDGAIAALQAKTRLGRFRSGRMVTDAGLALLRNFPMFRDAHGAGLAADVSDRADPGALLIDGPFTDDGLASLAGLAGVVELDLFWHSTGMTAAGFAHLAALPNLMSLGADGALTDDVAMRHIARLPRLRRLRAQENVATDDGYVALSRCETLEYLWGRECPNFGSRGFVALSTMPRLRALGIGCLKVDDSALAMLPRFAALRDLTPIGFSDEGFEHVGRVERLERLTCMYCRETTDAATEHIAALPLRYYYAGLTRITDRSLQVLGGMSTLEEIDLYECKGITDDGLASLARLPRLTKVDLAAMPRVTFEGTRVFPPRVRVRYQT